MVQPASGAAQVTRRRLLEHLSSDVRGMGWALAGVGLIACSGRTVLPSGAGAQSASATSSPPQRVDVWWPYADNNPSVPPAWDDFKQRHPGWTGELTMGVTYEKFQASLAGGTVPDAYWAGFDFVQVAAYKGMFQPLDSYVSRDKVQLDQYFPASLAGARYKGKLYGLPHHSDVRSVYVNQVVLRDGGLDPNRQPTSWDDFRTANQRLLHKDAQDTIDRIGFDPTWQIGGPVALMYLQANGVPLLSNDGTQPGFATAAGIEALRWLADTIAAIGGASALTGFEKRFQNGIGEALARNAAGMALAGMWILGHWVYGLEPASQIAQWPMPGGPSARGRSFGYYSGTTGVVPAAASRPEAGWEFTKYQASPEGQRFVQSVDGSWDQACIESVANDPEVLKRQPWRKRANELLAQATLPAYFPFPGAAEIQAAMTSALDPLLKGQQGPDATMQDLKQQVQQVMDQYR
jgi:ABC-type glycerol-3-phosphate transport system substrate-binding protein